MSNYQNVRGYFEQLTYQALLTGGIAAADIHFDNFGETAAPSDRSYAVVSLSFGQGVEDVLSCEGLERLRGTINCVVYTPKQQGSKPGEDICLEVIKAWNGVNKRSTVFTAPLLEAACQNIDGPQSLAPDQRPHHANVTTCGWRARVV